MKNIRIICDGSSLGNGREAARAAAVAILSYEDQKGEVHHRVVAEYLGMATNNQAEIVAAAIGLESLKYTCNVEMQTDSKYVVETLKGNFKKRKNHEFWARLEKAAKNHHITCSWVRGHAGHPLQEECDKVAKKIANLGFEDIEVLQDALESVKAKAQ